MTKSNVLSTIAAHRAALALVYQMDVNAEPDGPAYDAAVAAEIAALDAIARAPCVNVEVLAAKLAYLAAWSREDDGDDGRLVALRTAAEGWLQGRALQA